MLPVRIRPLVSWLLGGFLLCSVGFYNGAPLVYPDLGVYIECGFTGEQAIYGRSMAYSFFIRHMSLATSLWYVIIAQGLLLSSVMYLTLKHLLPGHLKHRVDLIHLGIITVLALSSGLSVRVSQLMPDIFTPMALLCLVVVLFARTLSRWEIGYLSVVALWAIMSHNSNLAIFLLAIGGLGVLMAITRLRKGSLPFAVRRWLWAASLVAMTWVALPGLHWATGGGFRVSESSSVFLMGQLNHMGILPLFLKRSCRDDSTHLFCAYRDEMPKDFWWDSRSPLYRMGGWRAVDQDAYRELIDTILGNPFYAKLFIQGVATGALHQFFNFETSNISIHEGAISPYLERYFYQETYTFAHSAQYQETLDFTALNRRQEYLMYLSLLLMTSLAFHGRWARAIPAHLRWALLLVFVTLIANAVICGGLSNGAMRYQNRLIWVLPMVLSIIGLWRWPAIIQALKRIWTNA
jgi:hypothetical protein